MTQSDAVRRFAADPLKSMPAELRLLVDFCRPVPRADPATQLDWSIIALGIERHGLARLVPRLLAVPGLVPVDAVAVLRDLHLRQAASALSQLEETVRLSALLDEQGIRFILIKGVALSIQLYGRPGVRAGKDIDILIEAHQQSRVDALLQGQGYVPAAGDMAHNGGSGADTKEVAYINAQRGMMVEVHSRLTENDDLYVTDFDDIWQSRSSVTCGGRTLPVMAPERLSTYLSVHGTGHCWSRLMWLLDIVALTPTPQACESALADARQHQLAPVLLHTLWLLHHWLGHEVPPTILTEARSSLSARLLNWTAARTHNDRLWYRIAPMNSRRRFINDSIIVRVTRYNMKSGSTYWRHQLATELVSPSDRAMLALPPRLAWAYVLIRPFGWIIRRLKP